MGSFLFSERMNIPTSETIQINMLAQEKRARGERVYNLSVGEPDISIDPQVADAVARAVAEGKTMYPPVLGIPELRKSISSWMNHAYQTSYSVEETAVTNGGKFGLYALFQLLLSPGDEVMIIAPYWVSYPSMVHMAGGKTVVVDTQEAAGWKVTPEDLEKQCTSKTKILVLNNASNPTGTLYAREELEAIILFAEKHGLYIISDEVYSGLVYEYLFISLGSFAQQKNRIIVVQSASKNFAMTGLRVGYVFGPKEIITELGKLMAQSTTGVATLSQWAALAAVDHAENVLKNIQRTMRKRRDVFVDTWNALFEKHIAAPSSGLYAFISLSACNAQHMQSAVFCFEALEKANIAMVPGAAFGAEGYVRCSFGGQEQEIREAVKALHGYVKHNNAK